MLIDQDGPIVKKGKTYQKDCGIMILEWDEGGKYKGQWQDNMLEDEPFKLFFGPDPSGKCFVADLTEEEMRNAECYPSFP